ncbi:hypothetical protein VCEM1626_003175 [Vibrio cholerae O1 str. EM-1626]|nr:hypothetical protein VCEM1626_003175 [Vibrio cholerae O1 str. EM-1626]
MLSGISANAEIVKSLKQKPTQQQVVKSSLGKETQEQTQQRIQRALAAKQSKQANTGVNKQQIYDELNKARAKDAQPLMDIVKAKQTELIKCASAKAQTAEWGELVKQLSGKKFTPEAFDAFREVLTISDITKCERMVRELANRLNIVNGVIHLIK